MPEMKLVEERLRLYARAQMIFGGAVIIGMFLIIVVQSFMLIQARHATEIRKGIIADNCTNIGAVKNYFDSLDAALTKAIREAPPEANLTLIRELVDQARDASDAMTNPEC